MYPWILSEKRLTNGFVLLTLTFIRAVTLNTPRNLTSFTGKDSTFKGWKFATLKFLGCGQLSLMFEFFDNWSLITVMKKLPIDPFVILQISTCRLKVFLSTLSVLLSSVKSKKSLTDIFWKSTSWFIVKLKRECPSELLKTQNEKFPA